MEKKIKYENENFIIQNDLKIDKKSFPRRKTLINSTFQKEQKLIVPKLSHLEPNIPTIPYNVKPKINLNLLPIKKTRSKNENEINTFSLFFNGESNFLSPKNEMNQNKYGNNQLLIHKTSKDFTSKKIKVHNLNNNILLNNINNNNIKDEIEEKQRNNNNNTGHIKKRNITLNDLKNKKNLISELKNIKEIRDAINESIREQIYPKNIETNINLSKINKKLPGLYKKNNNGNIINYLSIPPRNKLITPLLQNRKKSEIIKRKIKMKEKNNKDKSFGHKIQWKKISLIKEGENSCIYKAFNILNGWVFIVKEYKIKNNKSKNLFYNEAKFLKKNRQKNIVDYINAEVVDNTNFYIYLNFIGGYTLTDFISKVGFFTESLLMKIISQIVDFLDYMKLRGLIYNNFSFDHIMFDLDGTIKIIDFSKVNTENENIKTKNIRHNDDVDFNKFKSMVSNFIYLEKSSNFKNTNDINYCNFLESLLSNTLSFTEFKNNYCKK
jgi:hypothetical protein